MDPALLQIANSPPQVEYMIPARGVATGSVASILLNNQLDYNALRPYQGRDGRSYITRLVGWDDDGNGKYAAVPTMNDATLRYDDWKLIDQTVIEIARPRLKMVNDLESRGLVYNLPNGIAKTIIQTQQMGDVGPATISMDALRDAEWDRPVFSTINFPLPIIHKDFAFSLRQLLESRTGQNPLDTTMAELSARKVAEQIEQLVLGTSSSLLTGPTSFSFAGATVYGYMNSPLRITYTITLPTAVGWTPDTAINDILAMRALARANNHFGPYRVYFGLSWDRYLDDDYKPTYDSTTLRERIGAITGIESVDTADYLPGYAILMVQMDRNTIRLVKGMDITTVQWEEKGGLEVHFKIMALVVPQIRSDKNNVTGIVHGS